MTFPTKKGELWPWADFRLLKLTQRSLIIKKFIHLAAISHQGVREDQRRVEQHISSPTLWSWIANATTHGCIKTERYWIHADAEMRRKVAYDPVWIPISLVSRNPVCPHRARTFSRLMDREEMPHLSTGKAKLRDNSRPQTSRRNLRSQNSRSDWKCPSSKNEGKPKSLLLHDKMGARQVARNRGCSLSCTDWQARPRR